MGDLLGAIREHYVAQFAATVKESSAHIEPAFRNADGSLSLQGALGLPCRADFIPTLGPLAGEPQVVDSESRLTFEPIASMYLSCALDFDPFTWDWVTMSVNGVEIAVVSTVIREWFYRWFDPDDVNEADASGLSGVVHFASDPVSTAGGVEVTLDLGSAPAAALEELLKTMATRGASQVRLV